MVATLQGGKRLKNLLVGPLLLLLLLSNLLSLHQVVFAGFSEAERLEQYAIRNYTWPITEFVPNTPGWTALMKRRIRQTEAIPEAQHQEKYDAWLVAMFSGLVAPNFTQFGWAVTKAPTELVEELQQALHAPRALEKAQPEIFDPAIVGDPLMVQLDDDLRHKSLMDLQAYFEAWSGERLQPQNAYGLRIYQNESALFMHLDHHSTHVISGILHVDHSDDSAPWPLVLEDFDGTVQKVILQKGDLLLYESAKCLHGRPIPFHGSWYTSLFLHYMPAGSGWEAMHDAPHFAVPPHWREEIPLNNDAQKHGKPLLPRLELIETAMLEPDCPNSWCLTVGENVATWEGQSKTGIAISAHNSEQVLDLTFQEDSKDEKHEEL